MAYTKQIALVVNFNPTKTTPENAGEKLSALSGDPRMIALLNEYCGGILLDENPARYPIIFIDDEYDDWYNGVEYAREQCDSLRDCPTCIYRVDCLVHT